MSNVNRSSALSAGSLASSCQSNKAVAAPRRPDLAPEPWRFAPVAGFPYFLVCQSERYPPLVVRVIHQRRDLEAELRDLRAR